MMTLTLGPDWQNELWVSPYRLRFELNESGPYLKMFTASYDRARRLARAALSDDNLVGIIAAIPNPRAELSSERLGWSSDNGFDHLDELGVSSDTAIVSWTGYWWAEDEHDDEAGPWAHRAVSLTWDQADILLWNQVAQDLGIAPRAPVQSKLVDVARGVSVNAYDDRGMDITALSKEPVAPLYNEFDSWLLDYDRSRMSEAFCG